MSKPVKLCSASCCPTIEMDPDNDDQFILRDDYRGKVVLKYEELQRAAQEATALRELVEEPHACTCQTEPAGCTC